MEKGEHIIAYAALGTYFFVMGVVVTLDNWATKVEAHNKEIQETIYVAEDMIGWMVEDVANNKVDSITTNTYIYNLEKVITSLNKIK